MYHLDTEGKRVYTLKKIVDAKATKSAHPARFSPDDKYSRHRVTLKKRFNLLPMQQQSQCPPPFSPARARAERKTILTDSTEDKQAAMGA